MKRIFVFLSIILIALVSCDTGLNEPTQPDSSNDPESPTDVGTIEITLPEGGVNASAWSNSDVSGSATHYEILVYNDSDQLSSGLLSSEGTHTLSADAGTYDVLVIAGISDLGVESHPEFGPFGIVLGFGDASDVTVTGGSTTPVTIGLDTYSWTTNWPTQGVPAATSFDLTVDLSFPTDKISLVIPQESAGAEIGGSSSIDGIFDWSEPTAGQFHGSASLTAPNIVGISQIDIYNLWVDTMTLGNLSGTLDSYSTVFWGLIGAYAEVLSPMIPTNSVIYDDFTFDLSVVENPDLAQVSVDLEWNPDQ